MRLWAIPVLFLIIGAMAFIVITRWPPHWQWEDVLSLEWHNEKPFLILAVVAVLVLYLGIRR